MSLDSSGSASIRGASERQAWTFSEGLLPQPLSEEVLNRRFRLDSAPTRVGNALGRLIAERTHPEGSLETIRLADLQGLTVADLHDLRGVGIGTIERILQFLSDVSALSYEELQPALGRGEAEVPLIQAGQLSSGQAARPISWNHLSKPAAKALQELLRVKGRQTASSGTTFTLAQLEGLTLDDLEHLWGVGQGKALSIHSQLKELAHRVAEQQGEVADPVAYIHPIPLEEVLVVLTQYDAREHEARLQEHFGATLESIEKQHPRIIQAATALTMRSQGETLDGIGDVLGVTRERVRQIIMQVGPLLGEERYAEILAGPKRRRQRYLEEQNAALTTLTLDLERIIIERPGIDITELAFATKTDVQIVHKALPVHLAKFVVGSTKMHGRGTDRRWRRDDLLNAVKIAGTFHFPLSAPQFDELVSIGEIHSPGSQTIAKRFGTWKAACEAAGVEPTTRGRGNYEQKWSWDEIVGFVVEYLMDLSTVGSFADYEDWRSKQTNEVPSGALVRKRMSTWGDAVGYALIVISDKGPLDPRVFSSTACKPSSCEGA